MTTQRLDQLSARQKDCLRLFYANYGAKEIAARLNISPNTVNQHLLDARRLLGVSRSMEAARLLVTHEGNNRVAPEQIGIAPSAEPGDGLRATTPDLSATVVRNRYPFGFLHRIGLIVAIAFGAVALAGGLLVGAEAITQIFRAEQVDISDYPYRQ